MRESSAKFNTNISTLRLPKNYCSYNFSIKQGIIRRKFLLRNILLNSIPIFHCSDCIKTIEIQNFSVKMDTLRRKFLLGNFLLNSILIFQYYDCIKTIDIRYFFGPISISNGDIVLCLKTSASKKKFLTVQVPCYSANNVIYNYRFLVYRFL